MTAMFTGADAVASYMVEWVEGMMVVPSIYCTVKNGCLLDHGSREEKDIPKRNLCQQLFARK